MTKQAFITGNSSGLGKALSELLLQKSFSVAGLSRRGCELNHQNLRDVNCDLTDYDVVPSRLENLLSGLQTLELVILNAGILGEIKLITETSLTELQQVMDINVWSNKAVLDWLVNSGIKIKQIVMISSGAAVLGNKGWGGYAISKAALNMLARLYAHEMPGTHISTIAPGLIDTGMMDYLCDEADSEQFPALKRLQQARGTDVMLLPRQAAERILKSLPELQKYESGSFVDLRQIFEPEEYKALMKNWKTPVNH